MLLLLLTIVVILTFNYSYAFRNIRSNKKVHTAQNLSIIGNLFGKMDKTGVPIIDAVIDNKEEEIRKYILTDINNVDAKGNTAMHIIAKLGHYKYPPTQIPTLLIDNGININAKNADGLTALEISLLSGWQKISYLLLERGADKSVVTQNTVSKITCPDCKKVVKDYQLAK